MAFWEKLTIAEMNSLMEDQSEVMKEGWSKLSKLLEFHEHCNHEKSPTTKELSDFPLAPALYFFLCVRKSAENTASSFLPKEVRIDKEDVKYLPLSLKKTTRA